MTSVFIEMGANLNKLFTQIQCEKIFLYLKDRPKDTKNSENKKLAIQYSHLMKFSDYDYNKWCFYFAREFVHDRHKDLTLESMIEPLKYYLRWEAEIIEYFCIVFSPLLDPSLKADASKCVTIEELLKLF
jgi:hypothetical protein